MWLRFLIVWFCTVPFALATRAAEPAASVYQRVEIEPTKTSIYVGTVTMTMPVFTRKGVLFESTYRARVFPYFFYNEEGRLYIEVTDEMLQRLARGEPVDFTGRGVRDDGALRQVEGHATPADAVSGKLKVRVSLSKRIQLIFHTTYRFVGPSP